MQPFASDGLIQPVAEEGISYTAEVEYRLTLPQNALAGCSSAGATCTNVYCNSLTLNYRWIGPASAYDSELGDGALREGTRRYSGCVIPTPPAADIQV